MRGLFLHGLTSLMGDVVRGVAKSTSRMKESVLFHEEEEEKKHTEFKKQMKQMETREKTAQEIIDKSKVVIAHLKARAKENEGKNKKEVAQLKGELEERNKKMEENEEKNKKEVAHLKGELEERNQKIKTNEEKKKKEVAHLQEELEGRNKKIQENEEELKTREKRAKEDEARNKKEVAQLKGELEERNQQIKTNEEKKKKEVAHLQNSFHIRLDGLKKKLDNKDEVIGELKKHNAGLRVAFDLNAGVNMQIEDLDAKIEEANLEARNLKRSRQDLEVAVGPEMKKVCAAVIQLRNDDVATGLKMLEASANIIAPALAISKNQKRRAQRAKNGGDDGLKGNKYCGICKDLFRLDL